MQPQGVSLTRLQREAGGNGCWGRKVEEGVRPWEQEQMCRGGHGLGGCGKSGEAVLRLAGHAATCPRQGGRDSPPPSDSSV